MGCELTYKAAGTLHSIADQGKTWSRKLIYRVNGVPFDTTGFAARMMVRRTYDSTPVVSLTSAIGGGLTLGGVNGEVDWFVSAVVTEDLAGKFVFDVELYDPSVPAVVYGLLRGTVEFRREVTYA